MVFANKILTIITGILILNSCTRNSSESEEIHIGNSAILKISKTNGENFLETINVDDIKLYYKKNENLVLISNNSDYPKGFLIFQESPINQKMIKIFCYIDRTNSSEETYIKWNESDMDTLSYNIKRYDTGSIDIINLKFNSIPITNNNENGGYELTKE